tara:strand:+ start:148 stop:1023 length:876 start_codon:yes stop_codon:yes gene_type:complete
MFKVIKDKVSAKDVASNLSKYISSPPENSRVVTFTPEVAAWVLETYNMFNRPKKPERIRTYAAAMSANEWGITGATIVFSDKGRLRDGQNRMMACVRSGKSFTSHVVFGIDDDLFHVMDTGKPRGPDDILFIAGYQNTKSLAAALRWAYILKTDPSSRVTLTNKQVLDFVVGDYQTVEASLPMARKVVNVYRHPVGQLTALHWLFSQGHPELADEFFVAWGTGKSGGRYRPVARLQATLASYQGSSQTRIHDTGRAHMIVVAWNLFVNKRAGTANSFTIPVGASFPKVEGL